MTGTVVVIGNFDGVHAGHREVLRAAQAAAPGAPLVVVTFWPHPLTILRPEQAPQLLTNLSERIRLLKAAGAHEVRVVEFTAQVAAWTPEQFVESVLLPLHPLRVVVGENFRFGHRASGDVATLRALGTGRFEVEGLPLVRYADEDICSTSIRQALRVGDVENAAHQLERPFRYSGIVVMGDQRGRELGYPTANLAVPSYLAVPADGVYAGWLTRQDVPGAEVWPAAISVGTNPTFDGVQRRVESYVLGRTDLELYGIPIAVDFVARLRGQVKFDSLDALVVQMADDVSRTADMLGVPDPGPGVASAGR